MAENSSKVYYGFYVVAGLFVLMLPASLIMSAASIFYTPVTEELGISLAAYGVNLSIIQIGCALCVPTIFSAMCRKIKMRYVLTIALLVEVVFFALRAVATNIWMFYISSVFLAMPMAMFFNLSIQILMTAWFPFNPGTFIGIVGCAQGLGGLAFSSLGGIIIQNFGWRICFWSWAGICLVMVPIAFFVIRNSPAEKNIQPFGSDKSQNIAEKSVISGGVAANKAFRTPAFIMIVLALFLSTFVGNYHGYINAYIRTLGFSAGVAGTIYGVIQAGTLFYKLTIGTIADKSMKGGVLYYMVSTLVCFCLFIFGGANVVFMVLACFLWGGIYAATNLYGPLIVKHLFGLKDFIKIWSVVVGCWTVAGAAGAIVWGVIVEATSFRTGFVIALILSAVILVTFMLALSQAKKTKLMWITEESEVSTAS
ncbi:MAG: MFS transporter [Bacteroidales bacterium]|jgi:predicted MFS family arabinose efflux permease|nr:MFS transporter [Bacteroidales bacterium]